MKMTALGSFETTAYTQLHGVTSQKTWIVNKTAVYTAVPRRFVVGVCKRGGASRDEVKSREIFPINAMGREVPDNLLSSRKGYIRS